MREAAEYLLKKLKEKGADDVVIRSVKSEGVNIKFANNKVVKNGLEMMHGIGVFFTKDKKILATNFQDKDPKNLKKQIDNFVNSSMKFSSFLQPSKDYNGIANGNFKYKDVLETYDKKVESIDEVDYVQKGINTANSEKTNGIFEKNIEEGVLLTSNNVDKDLKGTYLYFSIRAFNKDGSGHSNTCSRMLSKLEIEKSSEEAAKIAKLSISPKEGDSGKYDIVFGTMPTIVFANQIAESCSPFSVEAGISFFADKINKKVTNIDFIDDGLKENGYNSTPCDDEGVPTQRTSLIKDGILKTYLHNSSTAKKYKTQSTGNAGLVEPHASNLIIEKGKCSEVNDLVKEVKNGLYVTNVWYTRYQNYLTGDFSTIPRDGCFVIKNGELKNSVKNIRISDNMLNILSNIVAISKEKKQLKSWEAHDPGFVPEILVKNVNVSKAKI